MADFPALTVKCPAGICHEGYDAFVSHVISWVRKIQAMMRQYCPHEILTFLSGRCDCGSDDFIRLNLRSKFTEY